MKLKHYDGDNLARFITFCTHKKIPLLTNKVTRQIVIDSIDKARELYAFKLLAYVIMPEHIHLVIIPGSNTKAGQIIGDIKRFSANEILNMLKFGSSDILKRIQVTRDGKAKHAVWQRRCYDHNCRNEDSLRRIIEYCHNNPVKRGLVKEPGLWQWSSYVCYQDAGEVLLEIDAAES